LEAEREAAEVQAPTIDLEGQPNQAMARISPESSAIPNRISGLKKITKKAVKTLLRRPLWISPVAPRPQPNPRQCKQSPGDQSQCCSKTLHVADKPGFTIARRLSRLDRTMQEEESYQQEPPQL
jgi:hypothetical protein